MPFDLFDTNASYGLLRQDGLTVSLTTALRTKRYVVLYIANQWWAPCRGVTSQLQSFYKAHHDTHAFEIIFLSSDRSKEAMLSFFHGAHGDWLCLDHEDARHLAVELAADTDLHPKQVPACLVFELTHPEKPTAGTVPPWRFPDGDAPAEGQIDAPPLWSFAADAWGGTAESTTLFARLVTKYGREMLSKDKEATLFPWYDDGWGTADSVRSAGLSAPRRSEEGRSPDKLAAPPENNSSANSLAQPNEVNSGEAQANSSRGSQQREEAATPTPQQPEPTSARSQEAKEPEEDSAHVASSSPTSPHLIWHHQPDYIACRPKAQNEAAHANGKEMAESHHHTSASGAQRGTIVIRRTQAPSPVTQTAVEVERTEVEG